MQRTKTGNHDAQIFTRTAMKTKAVNVYRTNRRGGGYF